MDHDEYLDKFNSMTKDEIELIGDDPTSCWAYAYIVGKEIGIDMDNLEFDIKKSDFKLEPNKIYVCFHENNTEMHYFVIETDKNNATVYSTYGGHEDFIKRQFIIEELEERIQTLSKDNFEYIFGIPLSYDDPFDCNISYSCLDV